jgi:hypothetical protein
MFINNYSTMSMHTKKLDLQPTKIDDWYMIGELKTPPVVVVSPKKVPSVDKRNTRPSMVAQHTTVPLVVRAQQGDAKTGLPNSPVVHKHFPVLAMTQCSCLSCDPIKMHSSTRPVVASEHVGIVTRQGDEKMGFLVQYFHRIAPLEADEKQYSAPSAHPTTMSPPPPPSGTPALIM